MGKSHIFEPWFLIFQVSSLTIISYLCLSISYQIFFSKNSVQSIKKVMQPKKNKATLNILKILSDQKTIFCMFSYHPSYYCPERCLKRKLLQNTQFKFSVRTQHGCVIAQVLSQMGKRPDCSAGSRGSSMRPDIQTYKVQGIY